MRFIATLLLALGACALAQTKKPPLDRPRLESYVRHLELLPADLPMKIGEPTPSHFASYYNLPVEITTPNGVYALHYFISADGQTLVRGIMTDLTKPPFEAERKQLTTAGQPSFGPADAPVNIVVFSDFQCPNCKDEAKIVHGNLGQTFPKDVRVFFKDFPLEKLHPWAKQAAIAGRCVYKQQPAAFWDFHDWIYEHQAEISPEDLKTKVAGFAETKNLDAAKLSGCIDAKATEAEIDREVAEGRLLGVSGTPTLFVNGRPLTGAVKWEQLEQIVKRELEYGKKSAEKCCEVSLPGLAK